ncbi:MAG: hypothetical protein GF353_12080 [Candidatus Lokiarchaeota archaeon]|nr:hypothetical protein [Candidatus Lokiarchaeota archaeon]
MSKRFKKSKKDDQIMVDEKKGHLYLGDKDLRLLMLRPIDLIEFTEFAGANSEDIIIWVGKQLAKYFMEKLYPAMDLTTEDLSTKKIIINNVLETLQNIGYGLIHSTIKKEFIMVSVEEPISKEERENIMAKNLCVLYQGIFNGILEELGLDADGEEVSCYLLGDAACVYRFDLLVDEFGEEDIDEDAESTHISNFLKTL